MKTHLIVAATLSIAVASGAATAAGGSYTGNYKVMLTNDVYPNNTGYNGHGPNTTHCISLTDDGSVGWTHSGYAELDHNGNASGQFAVIGPTIVIYVYTLGSGEEPASLVFTTTAKNGTIGKKGAYDGIQGSASFDAADAAFGKNGSC